MPTQQELDPKTIVIRRATRQRQSNIATFEDLKESISKRGIIQPLVARTIGNDIVLVVGERRLQASLSLGLEKVPVIVHGEISEEDAEIIELEENVKRKDLEWRDHARAVGRLHKMLCARHKHWKIEQTADEISLHATQVRKILHVFDNIDSAKISHVDGIEQAYNTLHRFAERKAESIVADIVANGSAVFGLDAASKPTSAADDIHGDFNLTTAVATFEEAGTRDASDSAGESLLENAGQSSDGATTAVGLQAPPPTAVADAEPILCANFLEWVKTYSGPKFSLVHCDFPYGNYRGEDSYGAMSGVETEAFYDNHEEIYWDLLKAFTTNIDKIMSYSSHLIFWFSMNFYIRTVQELRAAGLYIHDHPLVWHKTQGGGGIGVAPGTATTHPRRTYDTALLGVRGNRPLAKPNYNSYAAPTVSNKIHPSQKPESMLRFFLQMVVDETTTVLDPTCGSAAALRAAEDCGAKSILGIEIDPNYASAANTRTKQARVLRAVSKTRKDD